jgi:NAD(P)-dependent dehydrogenase (short-subunit alcohol dehydrogenase family)
VAPGTVLLPEGSTPELEERELAATPLRRLGSPDDVLKAVLFLAASPFVTGEVIVVDGGRHLGLPRA